MIAAHKKGPAEVLAVTCAIVGWRGPVRWDDLGGPDFRATIRSEELCRLKS